MDTLQTARNNYYHEQFQSFLTTGFNLPSLQNQVTANIKGWHKENGSGAVFCDLTKMFHAWVWGKTDNTGNTLFPLMISYAPLTKFREWLPEYEYSVGAKQLMHLVATYDPELEYVLLLVAHTDENATSSPRSLSFQKVLITPK